MLLSYINVKSAQRIQFIDITQRVRQEVKDSGMRSGVCYLFVPHTSAGITINEGADPSVQRDIHATLSRLIPQDPNYSHAEGNSDAHLKSSLVGASISIPVDEGALVLGTWQAIYFCEFDGPRHRRVAVKLIAG